MDNTRARVDARGGLLVNAGREVNNPLSGKLFSRETPQQPMEEEPIKQDPAAGAQPSTVNGLSPALSARTGASNPHDLNPLSTEGYNVGTSEMSVDSTDESHDEEDE